jgi:hypothetical protein
MRVKRVRARTADVPVKRFHADHRRQGSRGHRHMGHQRIGCADLGGGEHQCSSRTVALAVSVARHSPTDRRPARPCPLHQHRDPMRIFVDRAGRCVNQQAQGASVENIAKRPALEMGFKHGGTREITEPCAVDRYIVAALANQYCRWRAGHRGDECSALTNLTCRANRVRSYDNGLLVIGEKGRAAR